MYPNRWFQARIGTILLKAPEEEKTALRLLGATPCWLCEGPTPHDTQRPGEVHSTDDTTDLGGSGTDDAS